MPGPDRLQIIFALIDGCKARGVTQFKGDLGGEVQFVLSPMAGVDDALSVLTRPARDMTKCSMCQVAGAEPRYAGMCRACALKEAGVAS